MFSNIGWLEIFVIFVIAVIVIGPERLPEVLKDIRAAAYAARKAIRNARAELDGSFAEFEELREPLNKAAEWGRMGPRRAITKALFDDESFLEDFDPRVQMREAGLDTSVSPKQAMRRALQDEPQRDPRVVKREKQRQQQQPPTPTSPPTTQEERGSFSWDDIT